MQGFQGCRYRAGAVRKQWGSFPDSSREGKGFLKFWDWGMVGKGKWVDEVSSVLVSLQLTGGTKKS